MPKRRKRKTRTLKPQVWLWPALLINIYLGLTRSALTAPIIVRVEGAASFDRPRIQSELMALAGIPGMQVAPREVETRLNDCNEVDWSDFSRNIFGRCRASIYYRKPVARMKMDGTVALDSDGGIYVSRQDLTGLPTIELPGDMPTSTPMVTGIWPSGRIAKLCTQLPKSMRGGPTLIALSSRGSLSITKDGMPRIELGDTDQLDRKLAKLNQILTADPDLAVKAEEVNLVSPDHPAFTPRKQGIDKTL